MKQNYIKLILPFLWMGIIFYLSHQPSEFFPDSVFNGQAVAAHIFLYGVLAYLLSGAINSRLGYRRGGWRLPLLVITLSVLYGITDEYHQSFIIGRNATILDISFNLIGALMGVGFYYIKRKPRLLLHVCCIGCGVYAAQDLKKEYRVRLYFYNPNIYPKDEYKTRLEESKRIAKKLGLKLIIGDYNHGQWLGLVKGYEREPERGKRCLICYRDRLEEVARMAKDKGFDYFTTTLTTSPHKDAKAIIAIGEALANKYKIKFLSRDFKKQDGFKKAAKLSNELKLYRQNYCGCEFSMTK